MNIIAIDDEPHVLQSLERVLKQMEPNATLNNFLYVDEALSYAQENTVDVAFLDIEMPEMNGLLLAKKLKDIKPYINIIFLTGFSQYALDAYSVNPSDYLIKPVRPERVAAALQNLRHPVIPDKSGIQIQCFGNFEVFVDGKAVDFARAKSKEALAYLVDRKGAGVTKKELAAVLLEDKPYNRNIQAYLQNILSEMYKALEVAGIREIVRNKRGIYSLDTNQVVCDYYRYENCELSAVNRYHGEYMKNYSWAEFTLGTIK